MAVEHNRCLGITRNLKLCNRHGTWRIFCDDHKYFWIKYLIFFFGMVAGAIEFVPKFSSLIEKQWNKTDEFYGVWSIHYRYPSSNKNAYTDISGRVTYFENGKYNFSGKYSVQVDLQSGAAVHANYRSTVTGSWIVTNEYLTISLLDKQFLLDDVKSQLGPRFDDMAEQYFTTRFPLEQQFLNGLNDRYRIIKTTDHSIIIEGRDPNLDPITIELTRLDKLDKISIFHFF